MTGIDNLLHALEYDESPHFLRAEDGQLDEAKDFAHIFQKAVKEGDQGCSLRGVYVLRDDSRTQQASIVPVVYVCEAKSEADADRIHQKVWNQNVVPFLVVSTRQNVRLYSGFRCDQAATTPVQRGILDAAVDFNEVAERLQAIRANSIDDGSVWQALGDQITPDTRVDWRLLDQLSRLDNWLRQQGLQRETSHALIGKFVYLRYLRDRNILSDRKLGRWKIDPAAVFRRTATLKAFWELMNRLDDWLNGAIFPLTGSERANIRAEHVKRVAGTFHGDDPLSGQLHLDFQAYDFSYLPIETLSVIYEQFLHDGGTSGQSKGRQVGAYYTPIPLVNFLLDELDDRKPLRTGMKVLDPSCGSGAFLVQSYRRLIHRSQAQEKGRRLRPAELRSILEDHVFGIDRDSDACRVAELSLTLTLLDYVEPPDLENSPRFKLPELGQRNIFRADFFDEGSMETQASGCDAFDWIVGNPPWLEVRGTRQSRSDRHVWAWMQEHATERPTGGNQVAEAFAWKSLDHVAPNGVIGLLLPAMTLFKNESQSFRQHLFGATNVWTVANFANFAYELFGGRAERPAIAITYSPRQENEPGEAIVTYSPFVSNQPATRPSRAGRRGDAWSIVINAAEIREVPCSRAETGEMLPWKVAMWGTPRDYDLLRRVARNCHTLGEFAAEHSLVMHQGFELRERREGGESVEFVSELVGRPTVDFTRLRNCGRIFEFPEDAIHSIPRRKAYLRVRGGRAGLDVSQPPHVIVDASRRFAVYLDEFLAVPARQIGIAGDGTQADLLKSIALLLTSDFATYHQFFISPEWGISSNRSTLSALRSLPVPFDDNASDLLTAWAEVYDALRDSFQQSQSGRTTNAEADEFSSLLAEMNQKVMSAFGLRQHEQKLVSDFVQFRLPLVKGKVSVDAMTAPTAKDMTKFLATLRDELDDFVSDQAGLRHSVSVVHDNAAAMLCVELLRDRQRKVAPSVHRADDQTSGELARVATNLREQHSQWVYFDRGLRVYNGNRTYMFKPMQRTLWTSSQAMVEATEIIAETLAGGS